MTGKYDLTKFQPKRHGKYDLSGLSHDHQDGKYDLSRLQGNGWVHRYGHEPDRDSLLGILTC
jgi:hypothetical protein